MKLSFLIIALVLITAGCIGQTIPPEETYSIKKFGIEFVFSNPLENVSRIPLSDESLVFEKIVLSPSVRITFEPGSEDNTAFQLAGVEIASKLSHFYVYGQGRFVSVQAVELPELNRTEGATVIRMKGPGTGAQGTSVFVDSSGDIIVEGTSRQNLTLAADRLALVYLQN